MRIHGPTALAMAVPMARVHVWRPTQPHTSVQGCTKVILVRLKACEPRPAPSPSSYSVLCPMCLLSHHRHEGDKSCHSSGGFSDLLLGCVHCLKPTTRLLEWFHDRVTRCLIATLKGKKPSMRMAAVSHPVILSIRGMKSTSKICSLIFVHDIFNKLTVSSVSSLELSMN